MTAAYSTIAYREIYSVNAAEESYADVVSFYSESSQSSSLESSPSLSQAPDSRHKTSSTTDTGSVSPGYRDGLNAPADELPSYSESSYSSVEYRDYGVYTASESYAGAYSDTYSDTTAVGSTEPRRPSADPDSRASIDFFMEFPWNERFQMLLERPSFTPEEGRQRHADIDALASEFIEKARGPVKTIVTELSMPDTKKAIKPVAVGGVAGGEKYVVENLFIKFAKDNIQIRLYDGDDWAQKAALHELKSLNALIACSIPNLHFPMMALLSCYGHYVVVVCKLPLTASTLVYGSADASKSIHLNNDMEKLLKEVSRRLNLKPHHVREGCSGELRQIFGPVDIEGHRGLDGRFYVVDTARLFPPATPIRGIRSCHLYKLLRAELVRSNPKALSSDAFSFFGKPDCEIHNAEVQAATDRIFSTILPQIAQDEVILSSRPIREIMHDAGVNMRFLGSLLALALQKQASSAAILKILSELCARGSKALLFRQMRAAVHVHAGDAIDIECRRLAATHFSMLVGRSDRAAKYWQSEIIPVIQERFIFLCADSFGRPSAETIASAATFFPQVDPQARLLGSGESFLGSFISRSASLAGIRFAATTIARLSSSFDDSRDPLLPSDVAAIEMVAKRITVVPFVDSMKASGRFEDAERFYLKELDNRIAALGSQSVQVALTRIHLAELYAEQSHRVVDAEAQFKIAEQILSSLASDSAVDVADVREKRCDLLMKYDRFVEAESLLHEVVQSKKDVLGPTHPELCPLYDKSARVATRLAKFDQALRFYDLSLSIKEELGMDGEYIARSKNGKAQLLFAQKKFSDAKSILEEVVLRFRGSKKGKTSSELGIALDNLGQLHAATGDHEKAKELFEEAIAVKKSAFGDSHSHVAMTLDHYATNELSRLRKQRVVVPPSEFDSLRATFEKAVAIFRNSLGNHNSAVGVCLNNLALLFLSVKKLPQARATFQEALAILEPTYGSNHPVTKATKLNLSRVSSILDASSSDKKDHVELSQIAPAFHSQDMTESGKFSAEKSEAAQSIRDIDPATAKKILEMLRLKKLREESVQMSAESPSALTEKKKQPQESMEELKRPKEESQVPDESLALKQKKKRPQAVIEEEEKKEELLEVTAKGERKVMSRKLSASVRDSPSLPAIAKLVKPIPKADFALEAEVTDEPRKVASPDKVRSPISPISAPRRTVDSDDQEAKLTPSNVEAAQLGKKTVGGRVKSILSKLTALLSSSDKTPAAKASPKADTSMRQRPTATKALSTSASSVQGTASFLADAARPQSFSDKEAKQNRSKKKLDVPAEPQAQKKEKTASAAASKAFMSRPNILSSSNSSSSTTAAPAPSPERQVDEFVSPLPPLSSSQPGLPDPPVSAPMSASASAASYAPGSVRSPRVSRLSASVVAAPSAPGAPAPAPAPAVPSPPGAPTPARAAPMPTSAAPAPVALPASFGPPTVPPQPDMDFSQIAVLSQSRSEGALSVALDDLNDLNIFENEAEEEDDQSLREDEESDHYSANSESDDNTINSLSLSMLSSPPPAPEVVSVDGDESLYTANPADLLELLTQTVDTDSLEALLQSQAEALDPVETFNFGLSDI